MVVRDKFEKWAWSSGSSLDLSKNADGTYKSKETASSFTSFVGALNLAVDCVNDLYLYYVDGSQAAAFTERCKEELVSHFGLGKDKPTPDQVTQKLYIPRFIPAEIVREFTIKEWKR